MQTVAFLAVVLSLSTVLCGAEPDAPRQYLVKLKFCEGKADAKADDPTTKVLSMPQVVTQDGKTCSIKAGSEVMLPDFGTKAAEFADTGIRAIINCRKADDESVRLDMQLSHLDVTLNQPELFILHDVGARVLLKAKFNTPIKTVLQEQTKHKPAKWVEVEVEEVVELQK